MSSYWVNSYGVIKIIPKIVLVLVLLLISSTAFAHGGRTNSEGCHNNRSTGDYHCHNQVEEPVKEARSDARTESRGSSRSSYTCTANTYNCSDFIFHQDAQNAYEFCLVEVGKDIHDLDRDNDNVACEALVQ